MILIYNQEIEAIENHINQLYDEFPRSRNKQVLSDIIDYWELELIFKQNERKKEQLKKELNLK